MESRRGEKLGWIVGWVGSFLWVVALAGVRLGHGDLANAAAGLALAMLAGGAIFLFAPWKHPAVPFWRLMLPLYGLMAAAVAWAIFAFGGSRALRLDGFEALWIVPLLLPLLTVGARCWKDGERS